MKNLSERLRYAMEVLPPKKIKGVDLARAVGVKPPSVSDWLSGKSKTMEGENLLKASKFLGVNPSWLATGVGEISPNNAKVLNTEIQLYDDGDPVPDGFSAIDFYDEVYVSAGSGYLNIEKPSSRKFFIPTYLLQANDVRTNYAKVVMVHGDSMFPVLVDGCPISIDMSAKRIIDGEIYAFQIGDETKVKYLYPWTEEGKGGFIARSANPDKNRYPDEYYSPARIEAEGITIIGQYWAKLETKKVKR